MERTFKATLEIEGFHAQDVEITVHDTYSWVKDMRDKRILLASITMEQNSDGKGVESKCT